MRVLFQDFLSNRGLFYDQFNKAAKNIADMATLLNNAVNNEDAEERANIFKQIDRLEHIGDEINHKIHLWLNKIVFTPFNRNDIHNLISAIDDIADMIKDASGKLNLYDIDQIIQPIKDITAIAVSACIAIKDAVNLLQQNKQDIYILELCRDTKNHERKADRIYYNAIADLFLKEKDPIILIKYREILHSLETTVNKCKCAADALEVILINR